MVSGARLAWEIHTYNGPRALVRADSVSVNGIAPAGFISEARAALVEALAAFIGEEER